LFFGDMPFRGLLPFKELFICDAFNRVNEIKFNIDPYTTSIFLSCCDNSKSLAKQSLSSQKVSGLIFSKSCLYKLAIPIMTYSTGYPSGYNHVGSSQNPQYPPPSHPQSYPPVMGPPTPSYPPIMDPPTPYHPHVMGPPAPYYPPPGPYVVPPPPQMTRLFDGGFGIGLLSGAREGLLLGQELFAGFGGGAYGDGGTSLQNGAPQGLPLAQALLGELGGGEFGDGATSLLSGAPQGLPLAQALLGGLGGGEFGDGGTGLLSGAPQGLLLAQALLDGLGGGTF
jgi:hypothetical protein